MHNTFVECLQMSQKTISYQNNTEALIGKIKRHDLQKSCLFESICYKEQSLFVTADCSDTRKNFTFDSFQQSTTTCRDVRNLIGHTEFVDASYRVTTTNQ